MKTSQGPRDTQANLIILDRLAYTPINADIEGSTMANQTKIRSVLAKITDKDMRGRTIEGRDPISSEVAVRPTTNHLPTRLTYDGPNEFGMPQQPRSQ